MRGRNHNTGPEAPITAILHARPANFSVVHCENQIRVVSGCLSLLATGSRLHLTHDACDDRPDYLNYDCILKQSG